MTGTARILAACTGGGVGDLLAAMPSINALARHFDQQLDVLTTPYASDIIAGQRSVAEVLVDDGSEAVQALAKRLAARRYSHAVVFWSNPRVAKTIAAAEIPIRVGQARRLYSFRYTKRVSVRSETGDTSSHWTDIQMDYARALGVQPVPADYQVAIVLDPRHRQEAAELIARTTGNRPFIIFHAARGITASAARWPSANFAHIADALAREFQAVILLSGHGKEASLVAQTADAMREPSFDICGQTSLRGFAALSERAAFVVALDSGPMHIAAAAGAPTIGIFALRTDLPNRWRPLGPRVAVVGPAYPCPPRCRKETCATFACYGALNAGTVMDAAHSVYSRSTVAAS